jgi:hypothetical protein
MADDVRSFDIEMIHETDKIVSLCAVPDIGRMKRATMIAQVGEDTAMPDREMTDDTAPVR